MALKITFGNQKGGTGKTTLSVLLATALSSKPFNHSVCVVDCDEQKSIVSARLDDMVNFNGVLPYEVYNYNVPTLQKNITKLNEQYDLIIIDAAGKLDRSIEVKHQEIAKVLDIVDILLIPFVHGNYTLNATIDYLRYVIQLKEIRLNENRPLVAYGLLNMYDKRLNSSKDLVDEVDNIKLLTGIEFIQTPLKSYTLYRTANTINSLYNLNESKQVLNLKRFIDNIYKIITE